MSKKKSNNKNIKKRNWAFVLYFESAPKDWRERLQATGLPIAISPLHNRDMDPTGEVKKEHYHIILCYAGPTSYNVVKNITDILRQPAPQPLESIKGYYRYFTHKDNPEKAQYDEKDIQCLNGFNILDFIELTRVEVFQIKLKIYEIIQELNFIEYDDLNAYLKDIGLLSELEIVMNHTIYFNAILKSRRHKLKKKDIL